LFENEADTKRFSTLYFPKKLYMPIHSIFHMQLATTDWPYTVLLNSTCNVM